MREQYKLAIDVGGTFTDVVLFNENRKKLRFTKTPSSPGDPSHGVIDGIKKILHLEGIGPESIHYFVHGTTFATNAFLENKGAKVALFTTKGFRDVVEIGRQKRPKLYDLFQDKPSSLVERRFRFGIEERMGPDGQIIKELNEASVLQAIEKMKEEGIKSVAVVYLHAYINPEHELKTAELIKSVYPECNISLSHEISPEFREYERTITTVVNAYLKPATRNYFMNLVNRLHEQQVKIPYIMKSSGGVMTAEAASEKVVETLLSGPAGGVIGSTFLAKCMGIDNIITLDMGGTSTDVALILNQAPRTTLESTLKGYPLKVPMIEMETVGAGGGSIGWVDEGGLLKVGPESAGAIPGAACYGKGGTKATITDANLLLGKIDPDYFLGGEMQLDVEAARRSFEEVMSKTGLSLEEAAVGIVEIANHHMIEAVRLVSIQKGFDPKDFTLFAFGGASPLHATEIAKELGIPRVVIPRASSEMSAFGFLAADIRHDFAITRLLPLQQEAVESICSLYRELGLKGEATLDQEGVAEENRLLLYRMDLRYRGQAFELTVDLDSDAAETVDIARLLAQFHVEYERQYGHCDKSEPVEIVNFRLSAIGITPKISLEELPEGGSDPKATLKGNRCVYSTYSREYVTVPVYDHGLLLAGNQIEGPAIIESVDTTIALEQNQVASMDRLGNMIITIGGEQ